MTEIQVAQEELKKIAVTKDQLQNDVSALSVSYDDYQVKLADIKKEIVDAGVLDQSIADKKAIIITLDTQISEKHSDIDTIDGLVRSKRAECDAILGDIETVKTQFAEVQQTLTDFHNAIAQAKIDVITHEKENQVAISAKNEAQNELLKVSNNLKGILDQVESGLRVIETHQEGIESLLKDKESIKTDIDTLTQNKVSLTGDVQDLTIQKAGLATSIDMVKATMTKEYADHTEKMQAERDAIEKKAGEQALKESSFIDRELALQEQKKIIELASGQKIY